MRQRHFLRQPDQHQPLGAEQHRPVAARALQHQSQTQAKREQQHRQFRAFNQMQADAPQAKPGGREDKKAGDDGDQPRKTGLIASYQTCGAPARHRC
jgi:hypothetical protein